MLNFNLKGNNNEVRKYENQCILIYIWKTDAPIGQMTLFMYMELTVPADMAKYFCEDNNLKQTKTDLKTPNGSPKWFNPPKGYEVWLGTQGSKYFINPKTGHMFMYEVQL